MKENEQVLPVRQGEVVRPGDDDYTTFLWHMDYLREAIAQSSLPEENLERAREEVRRMNVQGHI